MFGRLACDAQAAGALKPPPLDGPKLTPALTEDLEELRATVMAGVPDEVIAAALTAWAGVFGVISFEIFGQFNNVLSDRDTYFGHAVAGLGHLFGLAS